MDTNHKKDLEWPYQLFIQNISGNLGSSLLTTLDGAGSNLLYESTGQFLTINLRTDFSVQKTGFFLQYFSLYNAGSSNLDQVSCSPVSSQLMFTASTSNTYQQLLNSFPALYSGSDICYWTLDAGSGNVLNISVVITDLKYGPTCTSEGLYIYDGNSGTTLLRSVCDLIDTEYNPVTITTSGQYAYMVFYKGSAQYRGFVLTYTKIATSGGSNQSPTVGYYYTNSDCGTVYLSSSLGTNNYITSQNYPSDYLSNSDCTWIITASENDTSTRISFETIDLEGCCDVITIYDGDTTSHLQIGILKGTYSSANLPTYESTGLSLLVHFSSDSSLEHTGFKLLYTAFNQSFPDCVNSLPAFTKLDASSSVQYFDSHPGYATDIAYSNDYDFFWIMVKGLDSDTVTLTFTTFSLEFSSTCAFDYLKVYDGPCTTYTLLYTFCGSALSGSSVSHKHGKYLLFHFHTDNRVTDKGFRISYVYGHGSDDDDGEGVNKRMIIVIIVVAFILFGLCGILCWCKKRQARKRRIAPIESQKKDEVLLTNSNTTPKQPTPQDLQQTQNGHFVSGPDSNVIQNQGTEVEKLDTVISLSEAPKILTKSRKKTSETPAVVNEQDTLQIDQLTQHNDKATTEIIKCSDTKLPQLVPITMSTGQRISDKNKESNSNHSNILNETIPQNSDFTNSQNLQSLDTAMLLSEVPKKSKKLKKKKMKSSKTKSETQAEVDVLDNCQNERQNPSEDKETAAIITNLPPVMSDTMSTGQSNLNTDKELNSDDKTILNETIPLNSNSADSQNLNNMEMANLLSEVPTKSKKMKKKKKKSSKTKSETQAEIDVSDNCQNKRQNPSEDKETAETFTMIDTNLPPITAVTMSTGQTNSNTDNKLNSEEKTSLNEAIPHNSNSTDSQNQNNMETTNLLSEIPKKSKKKKKKKKKSSEPMSELEVDVQDNCLTDQQTQSKQTTEIVTNPDTILPCSLPS